MGASLIGLWVACSGGRWPEIDWDKARRFIEKAHDDLIAKAFEDAEGEDLESSGETIDYARAIALHGLETWRQAWDGELRVAKVLVLKDNTHVLFVGGLSWGDSPFHGYRAMNVAACSGALEKAGFNK